MGTHFFPPGKKSPISLGSSRRWRDASAEAESRTISHSTASLYSSEKEKGVK